MHGLVNKSIQTFLRDNYGAALWRRVAQEAGLEFDGFEAMLRYDDGVTERILQGAMRVLDKPRAVLLEDIGAYLASIESLRRLLRFGGADYWEFLASLDELPGRTLMALPELEVPQLSVISANGGRFVFEVQGPVEGVSALMAGLLRAMADDYGALALIEPAQTEDGREWVQVVLLEADYAEGRRFDLSVPSVTEVLHAG